MKLNAEYFIEMVEETARINKSGSSSGSKPMFEYRHNPFRFDINGGLIDFEH